MQNEIDRRQNEIGKHRILRKLYERKLKIMMGKLTSEDKNNKMTKNNVLRWTYEDSIKWHRNQTAFYRDVNYPIAL